MRPIKRLTKEEAEKIIAAKQAKTEHARTERIKRLEAEDIPDESKALQLAEMNLIRAAAQTERIKRLEAEAQQTMQGRQGQDYIPDESTELQLAEKIIVAYLDDDEEASFAELKEILMQFAIDPRLVMTIAKRLLRPE